MSSTLAGASSKQDGDVVCTNDNPVSAPLTDSSEMEAQKQKIQANEVALGTFLKESVTLYDWLVNQIMSQLFKAAASTDESTTHNNHHDSQSTTHTEQSSQFILSQSSTNSNSTTTTIPDSIKALKGQIPILHRMYIYLGDLHRYSNAFTQAESSYLKATLTSNLPAFSNTFDSNIYVPAAPGLGSFLNDNQPKNPFGTRNPFAISMPSLGYGNQMTLDTQTMETTKVNGSNEIPPSQSSRLSEYTKVKNVTPTDLNSLSFDFDQNDFLRNLGIFSGDEETQAAEGSGISSLLSSSLNGKSTTSGDEYTTCTTNSTPFTKNPFA